MLEVCPKFHTMSEVDINRCCTKGATEPYHYKVNHWNVFIVELASDLIGILHRNVPTWLQFV